MSANSLANTLPLTSRGETGRSRNTAMEDIVFEFGSAISVPFKLYLIEEFQRLKTEENPFNKRKFSPVSLVKFTKRQYRYMKKRITQILVSLLTFYTNADIYAQGNEEKTRTPWSGSVSLNYDFTNNFTGNASLGYTRKNRDLLLDYSGHSDRIEISS